MSLLNKASLIQIPSGYKDGTLYSAKPTNGDGDFTFSRGSNLAATRVNSEGLIEKGRENLLLQSNSFNTTWITSNASVTGGQSGYDGSSDAWLFETTVAGASVQQAFTSTGVLTYSVYAKAGSVNGIRLRIDATSDANGYYDLVNGTIFSSEGIDASISDVGNGWYKCSLSQNVSGAVKIQFFTTDGTTSYDNGNIYIQDAQLEQGLVATDYIETTTTTAQAGILEDMPRLDYSGGASCGSLLLEPQRSNLLPQSEYFGAYSVNNGTATANQIISPEGILNAYQFTENTGTSAHYIDTTSISVTSGNSYVISLFAKYDGRFLTIQGSSSIISSNYATFNLQTGVVEQENIGDASIEDYGNGWYRCIFKITATGTGSGAITILLNDSATGGRSRSYTGDGQSGIYIHGFQVEAGSYSTSLIPTYGSSVTRSADSCTDAGNSSLFNDSEGVLFVEIAKLNISATEGGVRLSKDTNNEIRLNFATSNRLNLFVNVGGSNQVYMDNSSYDLEDYHKIAIKYKLNDYAVYVDGTNIHTDTSATVPTGLDELYFNTFYGKVKSVKVFNTALTNDELADLTTI